MIPTEVASFWEDMYEKFQSRNRETYDSNLRSSCWCNRIPFQSRNRETYDSNQTKPNT